MKKWIIYMLLALFTATSASAQWWKLGLGKEEAEQPQQQQMRRSGPQGGRGQMSEEKRAEMKAKHEKMKAERAAIQKLAEAARNETDPAKKAELTNQLRVKVTEGAEKRNAEWRERLEKAERGVAKMKERLAEFENNKDQKIEQHVQDLLDGKKPQRPEGKRPRKKGPPPTAE